MRADTRAMGWDKLAGMGSPRSQPNVLAGPYLERAAHWRKDEARLRAALADPATLFVPVWRTRSVVDASGGGRLSAHFVEGGRAFSDRDAGGLHSAGRVSQPCLLRGRDHAGKSRRSSSPALSFTTCA